MKIKALAALTGLLVASFASHSRGDIADISFSGPGVSGSLRLTYGPATDATYPEAFEVTGISGTFTDTNNNLNIVDAPILGLVPITRDMPETGNLLAPDDFSRFAVATGKDHGSLSFDNLYWPTGSVPTATSYQVHGGFLDIYGLLFDIGDGRVVNFWSNGKFPGNPVNDYGIGVATAATALDYVEGGVTAVPEPGAFALLAIGLIGVCARRVRRSR